MDSSPKQPAARLECCECAVPVAADGPQRAALLLPCQHVLHVSCVEFIKRRAKLMRLLSSDLESWLEGLPSGSGGSDGSLRDLFLSVAFLCPGCRRPVDRIVPLFASGGAELMSAAALVAKAEFEETLRAQRKLIHRLRQMLEQRESVTSLGHQCAALHERRAAGLREMDKYARLFPTAAAPPPSTAQDGAPGAALCRMGVAPMSSLEAMSTTQLGLFITAAAPQLTGTQSALRRERRAVERRRQRLTAVKARYHTMKEIAALDREIAAAQQQQRQRRAHHPPQGSEEVDGARLHQRRRQLLRQRSESGTPDRQPKRRREPAAIDVDGVAARLQRRAAPAAAVAHGPPIEVDVDGEPGSSGESYNVDGSDDDDTPQQQQPVAVDDDSDAVAIDDDDDDEEGQGADTLAVDFQDDEEGDGLDATAAMAMLPVVLLPRARGGAQVQRVRAKHIRLLPRMEDRLWQPSLKF